MQLRCEQVFSREFTKMRQCSYSHKTSDPRVPTRVLPRHQAIETDTTPSPSPVSRSGHPRAPTGGSPPPSPPVLLGPELWSNQALLLNSLRQAGGACKSLACLAALLAAG
jgi:hypothetical protein